MHATVQYRKVRDTTLMGELIREYEILEGLLADRMGTYQFHVGEPDATTDELVQRAVNDLACKGIRLAGSSDVIRAAIQEVLN